jgi:hypothetical protein
MPAALDCFPGLTLSEKLANIYEVLKTISEGGGGVDLSSPGPIGSTTPSTGAFTTLTASSAEIAGVSIFGSGFITGGALNVSNRGRFDTALLTLPGDGQMRWVDGEYVHISTVDTILLRDAPNTLAMRNGTNAQAFRLYNTYADASNYRRGGFSWNGISLEIGSEGAGTGAGGAVFIKSPQDIYLTTGGQLRWNIDPDGHIKAWTDNTYDIGASGANRPRNIYAAGRVKGDLQANNSAQPDGGITASHYITVYDGSGVAYDMLCRPSA